MSLLEGAGGRVRAARRRARRRGPRGAGRAPRPERAAALRSRRARARRRARGASTSAWAGPAPASPAAGCRSLLSDPELDPYGPDNPEHVAEPAFARVLHLRPRDRAAALPRARRRLASRPRAAASSPTRPTITPCATGSCPNVYAIVDSGHGFKTLAIGRLAADDILDGGEPLLEPSGSAASRRAPRTRPRRARTRGPGAADGARAASASAWAARSPARSCAGPPITITCECGEKRDLRYGEQWQCERCGKRWDTRQIPAEQYEAIRRLQWRFRARADRARRWSSPRWRSSSRSPATSSTCSCCCRWR